MQKQIRNQILNLSRLIFNENEFNKILFYLDNDLLVDLRLFIDEKAELLVAISEMDSSNNELNQQITLCNELEDIVIDAYLEKTM